MTATFLLPFAMGACDALGGDILTDAFGIVAMVAMTPLITLRNFGADLPLPRPGAPTEHPTPGCRPMRSSIWPGGILMIEHNWHPRPHSVGNRHRGPGPGRAHQPHLPSAAHRRAPGRPRARHCQRRDDGLPGTG